MEPLRIKHLMFFLVWGGSFALLALSGLDARGADWHRYGVTDGGRQYFYDKDSIVFLPEGVVRLWARVIGEEELKRAFEEKRAETEKFIERKVLGKRELSKEQAEILYRQWEKQFLRDLVTAERRTLIELNCREHRFRAVSGVEYNEKGEMRKVFVAPEADWLALSSGTPVEELFRLVCSKLE